MNHLIQQAIADRKLVEFHYQGLIRIAEPHVYGCIGLIEQLLVYQVRGPDNMKQQTRWRVIPLPQISNLRVLDETFDGKRARAAHYTFTWDATFAMVP